MSKVKIEDLENIVLEGGGAKGAAYTGAIRGIENALYDYYRTHRPIVIQPLGSSILDYLVEVDGKQVPRVRRFAGSSAGAITSFALALGLDSDMIQDASKFEFKRFLQDLHTGKYRMVAADGTITIGEDRWKCLGRGDNTRPYKFDLHDLESIKPSFLKAQVRGAILGLFQNVLVTGAVETATSIKGFIEKVAQFFSGQGSGGGLADFEPDQYGKWSFGYKYYYNILSTMGILKTPTISNSPTQFAPYSGPDPNSPLFRKVATKVMEEIIPLVFWNLSRNNDMNLGMDAVANVIWDRGMFSGFAVREFFYDMMIYAALHNTHFQRSLFKEQEDRDTLNALGKTMTIKDGRTKVNFSALKPRLKDELKHLAQMTFGEFFEKTGISLTLCVSNFTTDEPVYFSEITSPDFPVLEAVGASMSIPPAIKPVYSECDAIKPQESGLNLYQLDANLKSKRKGKNLEYFDFRQFEMDRLAIKKFLAEHFHLAIDSNNPMSFTGFQMLLLTFLKQKEANTEFKRSVSISVQKDPSQPIDSSQIAELTYDKMVFHYNVAFKGLLLDGGYRCNIPYNLFRNSIFATDPTQEQIDPMFQKTLAIKLDKTLPPELVLKIYELFKDSQEEMTAKRFFRKRKNFFFGNILKRVLKPTCKTLESADAKQMFKDEDFESLNLASYERIADTVIDLQKQIKKRFSNPWNRQKSMVAIAGEGYAFGSEEGQIRYLSDHQHIIPLYSYGLGTYDFDLSAIQPLVDLAIKKGTAHVENYFKNP